MEINPCVECGQGQYEGHNLNCSSMKLPDDIEADRKDRDEYDDRLQPPDEDVTPEKEDE